jgi:hypothetical protein
VNNHVAGVDQNPVGMGQAFDLGATESGVFDRAQQMVGQSGNVSLRAARRDDNGVRERRRALQIDGDDVLGLVVIKSGEDQLGKRFSGGFRQVRIDLWGGRGGFGGQETGFRKGRKRRPIPRNCDQSEPGPPFFIRARSAVEDWKLKGPRRNTQAGGVI